MKVSNTSKTAILMAISLASLSTGTGAVISTTLPANAAPQVEFKTDTSDLAKKALAKKSAVSNSASARAGKSVMESEAGQGPAKLDKATKDLGGANAKEANQNAVPLKPISAAEKKNNEQAANAINKISGVNIEAKDLQPPAQDPEIKGFHPIKRLLQPVIRLGKGTVELQQQMMKLDGPVGALEPAMGSLSVKMHNVDQRLGTLDKHLVCMDDHVVNVGVQMDGIHGDLGKMKSDITGLQKPLLSVLQPLSNVKGPLHEMNDVLAEMKTMMGYALVGIVTLTIGIVVGTPFAALYIWIHRRKIFPYMKEHEFPTTKRQAQPALSNR